MSVNSFLSPEEFYARLVETMPPEAAKTYRTMRHTRIEPAYRNRKFIVYEMNGDRPKKLDTVLVYDFVADDVEGTSMQLELESRPGELLLVGYAPVQVFHFPVFVCLPPNNKLRWSARRDNPTDPSLSFLMVIRTQSRRHRREKGVIYMETSWSFEEEFAQNKVA